MSALVLSVLVITLDGTIINVALPVLSDQLGATSTQLQWIGGGYLLVFGAAMLPVGLLGDRYGHKRLLMLGLVIFGTASAVGMMVHSTGAVIAVRAFLGLGAALIMPLSMAMVPRIFSPKETQRAIGVWTAAAAAGLPFGPLIGGWLLEHYWWGSIFAFNLPVVVMALAVSLPMLPSDGPVRRVDGQSFDLLGAGLGITGITALVFGTIQVPRDGWGSPLVLTSLLGSVVLIVAFVVRERRCAHPIVDLHLFANRSFSWGSLATVIVNFALMGLLFVVPQYLQALLGFDTFGTGWRLLPLIGGLMVAATFSEQLVPRFGARRVVPVGLVVLGAGMLVGTTTGAGSGYGLTATWLSIAGLGFGFAVVPSTSMVLSSLPREGAGQGSSLLETLQQLGSALGVALLGSVLTAGYLGRLSTAGLDADSARAARDSVIGAVQVAGSLHDEALLASARGAFLHGMTLILVTGAVLTMISAVLAGLFMPSGAGRASSDQADSDHRGDTPEEVAPEGSAPNRIDLDRSEAADPVA